MTLSLNIFRGPVAQAASTPFWSETVPPDVTASELARTVLETSTPEHRHVREMFAFCPRSAIVEAVADAIDHPGTAVSMGGFIFVVDTN